MKNQEKEQTEDYVAGCFKENYMVPHVCPVATGHWCKDYTRCKNMAKKVSYEEKISRILDNNLEANTDHQKAIENVKIWLYCEWQCSAISGMEELGRLLKLVDAIAERKIKEL